ncbi:hypothetical protein Cpap_0874 [Ruminiclostridium papyrosolvens DSM 2782]|uniref:Uncharacterized protein n=1 Tax=Ruminiclostridium papyrosolvens DSM 2782 TaxID=588581 RepID=F1TH22_9FIRM|nr:hypothetical protein [Ruminiclostridium papyrosolvens]EGD46262.1 hypothetical protein Cpap_0874 [Ruminiclostridium papyrosolvens DSM 2782]WES33016.1 hypothetical protein P0092_14765 [Ruminiclostridium papyrosolvens DSM 2782]
MDIPSIIRMLKEPPTDSLIIAVFIFVTIWLFKEIRSTHQKRISDELIRCEKNLTIYTKVFRSICKYQNSEIDYNEMSQQLEQLPSMCSKTVYETYLKLEKGRNGEVLAELKVNIENEMNFHKSQQNNELSYWVKSDSVHDNIANFIKKSPLRSFLWPIIYTFIFLLATILMIALFISFERLNTVGQIFYMFYLLGGTLLIIIFMFALEYIMFNKINRKKLFYSIMFVLVAIIAITIKYRPPFGGIVFLAVSAVYEYLLVKLNVIKKS